MRRFAMQQGAYGKLKLFTDDSCQHGFGLVTRRCPSGESEKDFHSFRAV